MDLKKSQWTTDGDNFSIEMPLCKIDKEQRLVSGWATLDNPDLQGDVVLSEASEKAFSRFRGNIREMHQPIAAGRMISYKPDQYYDTETKKFYNGIFVTAYISKGAQSTWEKVLDGTLRAFSIKGPIKESHLEFSKDAGRPLRMVKDYEMEELSLVDAGGNQLANFASISKVNGSYVVKGMVADVKTENLFYCAEHENEISKTSTEDSAVCPEGHTMKNIGWYEYDDDADKIEKVQNLIDNYRSSTTEQEVPAENKGGVDVAEENTASEAVSADLIETEAGEQGKAQSEVDSSVENINAEEEEQPTEAANVSEVEVEEPDVAKMFGDLQGAIESKLAKMATDTESLFTRVNEIIEGKVEELTKKHEELAAGLNEFKETLGSVKTVVKSLESATAAKKSGDLGGSTEEELEKSNNSKWGGAFLGVSDLN